MSTFMGFSYMKSKLLMFNKSGVLCLLHSKIAYPHGNPTLISNFRDLLQLKFAHINTTNHVRFRPSLSSVACYQGLKNSNNVLQHGLRVRFYSSVGGLQLVQNVKSSRWWRRLRNHKFRFIGCCFIFSMAVGCLEWIPVSNRIHMTIPSDKLDDFVGYLTWDRMAREKAIEGKILSPNDPESIRVKRVLSEILQATNNVLGLKNDCRVSVYVPRKEDLQKPSTFCRDGSLLSVIHKYNRSGHHPNKRVQNKPQKVRKFGIKYGTEHLDGLNWEVMVVDSDQCNACYVANGRIIFYTGWLKVGDYITDAKLATILSHEVGHGLARHISALQHLVHLVLHVSISSPCLFFRRKKELEADRIGMMLMAAAGYDPRHAPEFYEIFGGREYNFFTSKHPTGKKRAKELNKVGVMSKALNLYNQVQVGYRIKTFI